MQRADIHNVIKQICIIYILWAWPKMPPIAKHAPLEWRGGAAARSFCNSIGQCIQILSAEPESILD